MHRERERRIARSDPRWLLVALWALAAAFAGATLLDGVQPEREGVVLAAAQRVAAGQVPYRDFRLAGPPGQVLALGALAKALGPSLLTWRVLHVGLAATVALLAFVLARRHAPLSWALAGWVAAAAAMAAPAAPGGVPAALALGLGAIAVARRWPATAGTLAGAAALFCPELALAAALGVLIAARPGDRLGAALAAGVTGAVLAAGVLLVGGDGAARQIAPDVSLADVHVPPFEAATVLGALLAWAAATAARRPDAQEWALAPLALAGAATVLVHGDTAHVAPFAAVLAPMLAVAAAHARPGGGRIALGVILVLVAAPALERQAMRIIHPVEGRSPALAPADGVRMTAREAAALEATAAAVGRRVPRGAPILVVSDPLLYVLLERPNPTRYDTLQARSLGAVAQRGIVRDLARAKPRVVVVRAPGPAARPVPAPIVDAYLADRYRQVAAAPPYRVLARSGAGGGS
jgi:hypothetical protein